MVTKKLIAIRDKTTRQILRIAKDLTEANDFITAEQRKKQSPESQVDPNSDFARLMGQHLQSERERAFEIDMISEVDFYNYLLQNGRLV